MSPCKHPPYGAVVIADRARSRFATPQSDAWLCIRHPRAVDGGVRRKSNIAAAATTVMAQPLGPMIHDVATNATLADRPIQADRRLADPRGNAVAI